PFLPVQDAAVCVIPVEVVHRLRAGVDRIFDSGTQAVDYLDWYYANRGILDWQERADHPDEWRVDEDSDTQVRYFDSQAELDIAEANGELQGSVDAVFIPRLTDAAPRLTRDDPLFNQLISAGVLSEDVIEFGPGLALGDLTVSVTVDSF